MKASLGVTILYGIVFQVILGIAFGFITGKMLVKAGKMMGILFGVLTAVVCIASLGLGGTTGFFMYSNRSDNGISSWKKMSFYLFFFNFHSLKSF